MYIETKNEYQCSDMSKVTMVVKEEARIKSYGTREFDESIDIQIGFTDGYRAGVLIPKISSSSETVRLLRQLATFIEERR